MARGSNEVVVIWWRDIPAQVNAQFGRERKQVQMSDKFQRAIDRAKRKAHIYTADEDIAQWRRVSLPLVGDLAEAAERRLVRQFAREAACLPIRTNAEHRQTRFRQDNSFRGWGRKWISETDQGLT